ncbi:MarR family transcriptional regulator [Kitasatospora sp. NPDC049285]|uniref:MarR family transcriptional regulator n=1 Tax=Kitasatospora sp. NPDC049285 TaxID=3157096 RepID=UPI003414E022
MTGLESLEQHRAPTGAGSIHLLGEPGAVFHLARGRILGVESFGAPGVDTLLLRTGRTAELLGPAGLQAVCLSALHDAAFATAAGRVTATRWEPRDPDDLPWPCAYAEVEPYEVVTEARRRLAALAGLRAPVSPDGDRVVSTLTPWEAARHPVAGQRELLRHADGATTARDLAFILGRGLYQVTVELSRLREQGLVVIASTTTRARLYTSLEPRRPDQHAALPPAPPPTTAGQLPRRRPPRPA